MLQFDETYGHQRQYFWAFKVWFGMHKSTKVHHDLHMRRPYGTYCLAAAGITDNTDARKCYTVPQNRSVTLGLICCSIQNSLKSSRAIFRKPLNFHSLKPVNRAVFTPPPKSLAEIVERDAHQAPQDDKRHVRHDWPIRSSADRFFSSHGRTRNSRDKAVFLHPVNDELGKAVSP